MLVLTRKYQEKIRIGDNITITVLRAKGKAVRLGIEAPADVPVIRGELAFERDSKREGDGEMISTVSFSSSDPRKRSTCAGGKTTPNEWATDSRPDAVACATTRKYEPKVGLSRVPRSKVANLLPKLVSGQAPLRAMMEKGADR
ncbi:MAG TPA: carbon storage regulator [Lacipirellulaceae bacterium]|nr:carbon storage regulator [Lacipirellulaceae bacterium]